MAIAAVQRLSKIATAATSVTFASGDGWATPASGNLIVLTINSDNVASTPSGFTAGPSVVDDNAVYLYYKVSNGTESSITITVGTANLVATACEYSGVTASPFDVSNSSTILRSNGTTTTSTSVTTTAANDLIIAVAGLAKYDATGTQPTGISWTNSFTNQLSNGVGWGTLNQAQTFYAEQLVTTATAYSTSASWTNNAEDRQQLIIAFKESPATAVVYSSQRLPQVRDPGEVWWVQRDRRDANTVATPANPLPSPLDSAWQAGARYWHLYGDAADGARNWQSQQRSYVSDPSLLAAASIPAGTPARFVSLRDSGEVQWSQRRTTDVSLLASALLENELLGAADTLRHYLAAAYYERRLVPAQPQRESVPGLLDTAELENELLGGAETAKRANVPATHVDRRLYPPQPPRETDQSSQPAAPDFDPLQSTRQGYLLAATNADHRLVPQQRPYISDPSFYPTVAPLDPLTVAWGAGGSLWHLYNTAAEQVGRRLVPQQRERESDPALLASALLEDVLLGGADTLRRYLAAAYTDRREVPPQRSYVLPPSTALLEDVLLGGVDDWRRRYLQPAMFVDRRETVGWQPRWPDPTLSIPVTDPLALAGGVGGDMWRRVNTPAYADRRLVPQQPARVALYFDAGPGSPPLTLAWGAGGSLWHRYNRAIEFDRWPWARIPNLLGAPHTCITQRPNSGTTVYDLAVTARPFTGTTVDEC